MNLSIFPNGIDTFVEHYDIQPSDLPHIRRYQELKQKSYLSVEEQNELSNLTHQLREKIFLADDFNKLQDCITNLEVFFRDETQGHLDGLKEDLKIVVDKNISDMNGIMGEYEQLHTSNKGELEDIKQDIIQTGEDYINTSRHWYTSWVTTANQVNFNILEGSETIPADIELDFQEEILDLFLNGDMLLPDRDYTFHIDATTGKKQIIKLSVDLGSTLVANQRLVAKWYANVGKLYIDHSHEHGFGGKDAITVTKEMLHEDLQLQIGDTTALDNLKDEVNKLAGTKSDKGHKHTKSEITDFGHTHSKGEITDFGHAHPWSEVTGAPTSYPANGGNADTVDGKHASEFASSGHNHNGVYAPVNHGHGDLAPANHSHNNYAPTSHTHNYAPNNGIASTAEAQAGNDDAKYMTPLKVKQAIQALAMSSVPYAYMSISGETLSGSGSTTHVKLRMRRPSGDITVVDDYHIRVNKSGTYAVICETSDCELMSGGTATYGVNLNYNIMGMSSAPYAYFLQSTGKNFTYGLSSLGTLSIASNQNVYIGLGSSTQASGSYTIKAGDMRVMLIRMGD